MLTVLGMPRNRTQRVLWMLEELEAPYEIRLLKPRSEEARAINPAGKVPVLDDGGTLIPDSVAICQYLADKHDDLTYPAGTKERAYQDALTQFVVSDVDALLWLLAKHKFVNPPEYRLEDIRRPVAFEFEQAMARLDAYRGDKPFLAGDRMTVADLIFGHCASWAETVKLPLPEGRLADFAHALLARPALKRARDKGDAALAAQEPSQA
ncbi:MAG: glutathione S-transferase family protein [Pseudomonadota bacterium]